MAIPLFESARIFFWGIFKRFYFWIIPFLLKTVDLYERFILPPQTSGKQMTSFPSQWVFGILILSLFWAAIMTYHELWVEKDSLRAQLDRKQRRRDIRDALTKLLGTGKELSSRRIQNDTEYHQWEQDHEGWKSALVDGVKEMVSGADAMRVHTVSTATAPFGHSYNEEHNENLNHVDKRINILNDIIDRYQDTT